SIQMSSISGTWMGSILALGRKLWQLKVGLAGKLCFKFRNSSSAYISHALASVVQ
ncbi:hypothetical protein KI387_039173, partial [Taxus chinensis]